MARRGTFGRAPRTAPSLTNTLVAIAREMQNQRDQNIMSAWQKGGTFEGKKATDDVVLAHWKERLNGLSKDDPMYDTYQNAYVQYDYAIHESKQTVLYAQEKISDSQMAQFYLTWAKKVPKDSEFYRVLQRDGAQFMQSAKSKSEAGAVRRKEAAYQKALGDIGNKNERMGAFLTDTLTALAQRGDADHGIAALIGAPGSGSNLFQFDPSDPEQMLRLLQEISPPKGTFAGRDFGGAATEVLYHNDDGKGITGADIVAKIKEFDPKFSGTLDLAYVKGSLADQMAGIQKRIDLANKTGHISDANKFRDDKANLAALGRQVAAWPVQQDYMHARDAYFDIANDDSALPSAKLAAYEKYTATLRDLADDPRIETDDATRSALMGEADGNEATTTLSESFTQFQSGDGTQQGTEVAKSNMYVNSWATQTEQVNGVDAVWTTGVYDKDGIFTPKVAGPSMGAATLEQIKQLTPDPKFIYVPTAGGKPTPVLVGETPVYATATNDDGKSMNLDNKNPVATIYQVTVGGTVMKVYGFKTSDGTQMYSSAPPWREGLRTTTDQNGATTIDVSPLKGGPGFTLRGASGAVNTKQANPGEYFLDPAVAVFNSDPMRAAAGVNPMKDFYSPTLAALMSTPEGQVTLYTLRNDKQFKAQMDIEAHEQAGYRRGPNGDWVLPQGIDANAAAAKLATYGNQNTLAAYAGEGGADKFISDAQKFWDRVTTKPTFEGAVPKTAGANQLAGSTFGDVSKLPADMLAGTPLAALGQAFQTGTNNLKPADAASSGASIKVGTSITIPGVPNTGIAPKASPTAAPIPSYGGTATIKPYEIPKYTPPTSYGGSNSNQGNKAL